MESAQDIARELGAHAESFCRAYLPNGRSAGGYWQIADVSGAAGGSLAIRLQASGGRLAGKWQDYATGERGDLLDLIPHLTNARSFGEVMREARSFLGKPDLVRVAPTPAADTSRKPDLTKREKAARLFASAQALAGTLGERYLRNRDINRLGSCLRFHKQSYAISHETGERLVLPALLAAITDNAGQVTGVARTWLDVERGAVADIESPKRVMGTLYGNAVRFEGVGNVLGCGEGIETMLSVGTALPKLPIAACLTATHLGLFEVPDGVEQVWVFRDNDEAGRRGTLHLRERLREAGRSIRVREIVPVLGDFNDDLSAWGADALRTRLRFDLGAGMDEFA
ncbi:toprim domain-containing protein [Aureimonas sp. AU12]|uniref:DUF7146 domain-containing protein n=1 Tax=Aureimonas sp. AU12 TaxID=1638161 RepID=UPI000781B5FF|nr:toprim domain-containing protein [Aureimonas sp. AU12]